MALYRNFSSVVSTRELFKDLESLCNKKKFFGGWGLQIFCEGRHKWSTFKPPWPTSLGPGPKQLDGSMSLKFLLETRLQSELFDTLDDLLRFHVKRL